MEKDELIESFCDGACKGNPGMGGWASIYYIQNNNKPKLIYVKNGFEKNTTNQKMELTAMLNLLSMLPLGKKHLISSDSTYVLKGIVQNEKCEELKLMMGRVHYTGWIKSWSINDWKNSKKEDVKNSDLWQLIMEKCKLHLINGSKLTFQWVRGHSGIEGNEKADFYANQAIYEIVERKSWK